ncbi:DUF4843 domain-containing protein [Pedobacter faecalis]|uniref:DUF4843 domain-containing protein n=1 Tax=Pedobacter faecalis TaxID=3041495 RepID=UPI0025501A5B|nr:DUF4843 domain-containing protein [Pedobacter sp. ELA7]
MKKNQSNISLMLIALAILFQGCKKDEVGGFKANAAVNFASPIAEYSFMTNPENEYIQELEVKIIGNKADHDRTFSAEVVKDESTTASPNQYEILGGVVKAGMFTGKLSVKLKNSPELATKKVAVKLKLVDAGDFKAGNIETSTLVLGWTNQILVPNPWSYFQYFFTTRGSTQAYRIILQTTGLTKFTLTEYRAVGEAGAIAMGTKFGDYVKQWNLDHPNDKLKHDDGQLAGQEITPLYYTRSKYD